MTFRTTWHIVTPEYPAQPGGVGDYARQVAAGLASAGDEVHVWSPAASREGPESSAVTVHQELGEFRLADLRRLGRALDAFRGPRRLLVQWVPHGYGWRAMNLPFCVWLLGRAARGDVVEVMIHEALLDFRGSWRQHAAAVVHRLMATLLLRAASRIWYAIPRHESALRPFTFGRRLPFRWLPVPSNIPAISDPRQVAELRARYAPQGGLVLGHFGTYGEGIVRLLRPALLRLADLRPDLTFLLLGRGGPHVAQGLGTLCPAIGGRLHAPGDLSPVGLSLHLQACDVLLQPYPDGVSCRRTTFMAGLANARPSVTTLGHCSEPFWATSDAVSAVAVGDDSALTAAVIDLLDDAPARGRTAKAAAALYRDQFDVSHIVCTLRGQVR